MLSSKQTLKKEHKTLGDLRTQVVDLDIAIARLNQVILLGKVKLFPIIRRERAWVAQRKQLMVDMHRQELKITALIRKPNPRENITYQFITDKRIS